LFIFMITLTSAEAVSSPIKTKSMITCDADLADTINFGQERSRGRTCFDVFKKMTFLGILVPNLHVNNQFDNYEARSLVIGIVQRNVFYVYACSTVP
jgi:hypothetical protein